MIFAYERTEGRLTLRREGTRWLSNGILGGEGERAGSSAGEFCRADAAHNLTVPEGFDRTDLAPYADERLGGSPRGPTLLTGVDQRHARGARRAPVEAVATAGLSNPAALPVEGNDRPETGGDAGSGDHPPDRGREWRPGTVNVFVGTTRALAGGALAGLLAAAVEAKAATLLAAADAPGTTSDAVAVGCDPGGEPARFAGSATEVGGAARVCVRDAVLASLNSRYADGDGRPSIEDAQYGIVSEESTRGFEP